MTPSYDYVKTWKINNIKYSFRFEPDFLGKNCLCDTNNIRSNKQKKHYNFCIVKKKYTYVIFRSGHINVCKVSSESEILDSLNLFLKIFDINNATISSIPYKIENICCHGILNVNTKFCLSDLYKILTSTETGEKNQFYFRYNTSIFPALYIKAIRRKGRILVFSSKKFVIVGTPTKHCLYTQLTILDVFMGKYCDSMKKETNVK